MQHEFYMLAWLLNDLGDAEVPVHHAFGIKEKPNLLRPRHLPLKHNKIID